MSASFIPAGHSLVEEAARIVESSGADPGEAVVVFPGSRPAHFLLRRLARNRVAGFVPPRILSMDELVASIVEAQDARAGRVRPGLDSIDAVAILYEIQVAARSPLGGPAFMTLDSFFPLGMKIWADLEELLIECVPVRSVAGVQALVQEEVPRRSRERLQSLAHFYEEFYTQVELRGFSTRASRYRQASDGILPQDVPGTGPLVLAGFSLLTAAEKSLFRTLAGWSRVRMVFREGTGMRAWMKGLPVETPPDAPVVFPVGNTHFTSSPDTHGQVFALNDTLGEPDESTVIVLPRAETLFPLLRHGLSRFDTESYNVSLPYPLQRTPLYGFLNNLMELVSSMAGELVYLPAYMAFVLHPYVKNLRMGASAEATRVLFHALEDRLADSPTRAFGMLEEIESDGELFRIAARRVGSDEEERTAARPKEHLADIHRRTLGSFRSFRSVREFAERCMGLISWVHDRSTARDHPYFTPFSEEFMRALETIARSLLADKAFNDSGSYFALLRRYLRIVYHHFPGTPMGGMQVLGVLETRSLSFERVFVLDANEGVLPSAGAEGSLLPFPVRAALGLPTTHDQEDVAAYNFQQLAAGAKELHLSYVETGDRERSRFVERLLWEQEKRTPGQPSPVQSVQYRVDLGTTPPPPIPKTPEVAAWLRTREQSATGLNAYLQCPLKFYYREVLKLSQREEPGGEIDPTQVGTFVHAVLQRYFSSRLGRRLLADDADAGAMTRLVDAMFPEWFGQAEAGAGRLLHEQVSRHLADFLTGYVKPLAARCALSIRSLEHPVAVSWKGFGLRGRIDAVEERDGRTVLVDYKTSSSGAGYAVKWKKLDAEDRATWSEAIPSLQLAFYTLLHAEETGSDPRGADALFLILGRNHIDEKIELPLFDQKHPSETHWPVMEKVLLGLLTEIVSPDVPFTAARDLKVACSRCDFTGICGTGAMKAR